MRANLIVGSLSAVFLCVAAVGGADDGPLVDAVKHADTAAVRSLLQKHVDVAGAGVDGTTALHWAAERAEADIVKLLIRAGANVDAANRYGMTPLLLAAQSGSVATVEALLAGGADANRALAEGETPIMMAARAGSDDVIRLLAARGGRVDAQESWHGQTAMMWAAAEGHAGAIKMLAGLGASPTTRTDGGFTPLLFAVRAGKLEAVRVLLELGADINDAVQPKVKAPRPAMPAAAVNNAGGGAGGAAAASLRPAAVPDPTSALILAITNKRWEVVRFLLDRGADPNDVRAGWTALHELAYIRRPNMGKGLPPQEEVEHVDTLDIARALIEHGADVNARQTKERRDGSRNEMNRVGATPLLLAAKHADPPFMQFLADHGADPAITTADHDTVLMAAAGVGIFNVGESAGTNEEAFEATKLAYQLGSTNGNAIDDLGWSALHGAAKRGSNQIVQFLVDHGATTFENRTKAEGWTPLRIADGVFVGATVKRADETAALLRTLMKAHGLQPPEKVANDVAEAPKPSRQH
jgi:ankyrin repeat protein